MKYKSYIISAILLAATTAAIFVGCKKEKENKVAQNGNEEIVVSKEDDMSAYLRQFKKKMQSAAKGDETLSMEDARWHLEAVLNYTYGDAGHQTSDIQCDTLFFELPTNGDEITLAQLNEAFVSLSDDVESAFAKCSLPDKSILSIQTTFDNNSKANSVLAKTILTTRGLPAVKTHFDETDYWNEWYVDYGNGHVSAGGKCGPYAGECPNSGAPHELTKMVLSKMPLTACESGNGYYTDVEELGISFYETEDFYGNLNDDFIYDENSPCGYKLYIRNQYNTNHCICPEDMNYYLNKGPELIEYFVPEGRCFISANYESDEILGVKGRGNCFHRLIIKFGILHCAGPEE
ncbi:MAG: hypothetical protein MJZ94_04715 [Bacteroidales bacterium]|nr:hypothetical protein [Bacteroidales bacterium]